LRVRTPAATLRRQNVNVARNDLRRVAVIAVPVLPLPGLQLAFHEKSVTLPRILPDVLRRLTPYRNSVPLRLLALLAGVTVFPFLRGRYAQRCHRLPCACVSNLRVLPQVPCYRCSVDVLRHCCLSRIPP